MANPSDLIVKLTVDASGVTAGVNSAENNLKKLGESAKSAGEPFAKLGETLKRGLEFAGLAVGIKELSDQLKESTKAAVEDQKSQALLARQLQNTTGANKEQIAGVEEAIRVIGEHAAIMDDKLRPAYATLIRATKDTAEATKLTSLATDVAAGTGRDLESVAIALAKAHNGNTSSLQRLGISVKGVSDPMAYLQQQFKGAAETAANTDPYQRMQYVLDKIHESIGMALLPILQKFAAYLSAVLPKVEAFFKQLTDPTTEVGKKWKEFTDQLIGAFNWVIKNADAIKAWLTVILSVIAAWKLYKTALDIATAAQWLMNIAMDANPVGALIISIGALVGLYLALSGAADKAASSQAKMAAGLTNGSSGAYDANGVRFGDRSAQFGVSQAAIDKAKAANAQRSQDASGDRYAAMGAAYQQQQAAKVIGGSGAGGGTGGGSTVSTALAKANAALVTTIKNTQKQIVAARNEYDKAVKAANDKYGPLIKQYSDEMASIIADSMNRLKSAFANATATDVGKMFADLNKDGTASADQLLESLKTRLDSIKTLATNAATLSGLGFSQTFIEQVVAQGPDAGNAMADALKSATPETQKQLQDLFRQTEVTSSTGMDVLAKQIYDKTGLATDAMKAQYQIASDNMKQAQDDLTAALLDAANALNTSLMKIGDDFTAFLLKSKADLKAYAAEIAAIRNSINTSYVDTTSISAGPGESASSQFGSNTPWALAAANGSVANGIALNNGPTVVVNASTNATPQAIADTAVLALKYGVPISKLTA